MAVISSSATRSSTTVGAYLALTKPRIIELLLITTIPAMFLAEGGWPGLGLMVATLIGGTLSAGGANAINQVLERDIDGLMRRTRARPLPQGAVDPVRATVFGVSLGMAGFLWLWWTVNLPSALLATAAFCFYVLVYTVLLKRSTPQNIVIGGAAGAVPVLVGWTAVTGTLAPPAWILFAIVFFWTPPHFWALALHHKEDYRRAGIPMLPVVGGERATRRQMIAHTAAMIVATIALVPVAPMGPLYTITALILGAMFVVAVLRVGTTRRSGLELFRFSITYLTVLFSAMAVDALLR